MELKDRVEVDSNDNDDYDDQVDSNLKSEQPIDAPPKPQEKLQPAKILVQAEDDYGAEESLAPSSMAVEAPSSKQESGLLAPEQASSEAIKAAAAQ